MLTRQPLQSIKILIRKRDGYTRIVLWGLLSVIALIVISCSLQKRQFTDTAMTTEDALAASNLASALPDLEEYGRTGNLIISDTDYAYAVYQEALKYNLGLDSNWECPNKSMISGKVEVVDYIVYNVSGNDIEVVSYGENCYGTYIKDGLGSVVAPNGREIENTSVYSKITFPVEGNWDVRVTAVKDQLVDIKKNE